MKRKAKAAPLQHTPAAQWKLRITRTDMDVDPKTLLAHPKNYRLHPKIQQAALTGALDEIGWWQFCYVSERGVIVDGHARVGLAIQRGEKVPVAYVDLSEAEEEKALASGDPLSGMAVIDSDKLSDLIAGVDTESEALDALFASLVDESTAVSLKSTAGGKGEPGESSGSQRKLGDRQAQIKPVLYADQVAVFERAIRATHIANRGEAITAICQAYLDSIPASELERLLSAAG